MCALTSPNASTRTLLRRETQGVRVKGVHVVSADKRTHRSSAKATDAMQSEIKEKSIRKISNTSLFAGASRFVLVGIADNFPVPLSSPHWGLSGACSNDLGYAAIVAMSLSRHGASFGASAVADGTCFHRCLNTCRGLYVIAAATHLDDCSNQTLHVSFARSRVQLKKGGKAATGDVATHFFVLNRLAMHAIQCTHSPEVQGGKKTMRKTQSTARRETRKQPIELPVVPDLGNLSMPRRTNRAATKTVAAGDLLWDKRRVMRKALKNARKRNEALQNAPVNIRKQDLIRVLDSAPGWGYDHKHHVFVAEHGASATDLGHALATCLSQKTKILLPADTPIQDLMMIRSLIPRGHRVRTKPRY